MCYITNIKQKFFLIKTIYKETFHVSQPNVIYKYIALSYKRRAFIYHLKKSLKYSEIKTISLILNAIILNYFKKREKKGMSVGKDKNVTVSTVDLTTAMTTVVGRME